MLNLFRSDGWVKTPLGPAVPGAQIWLCFQPANVASAPPSPLAPLFADPGGLVPITQPILTDGFGHYDFYTVAGVYTLVVAYGGMIQQVYPDQSVGGVGSGGGGTLVLQNNGAVNGDQLLLNLTGAGSVSVADNGSGTITITGTVFTGPAFKTNGILNITQNILNLVNGTGMSLTSDSSGDVTLNCTVTGSSFSGTGAAQFLGPGIVESALAPVIAGVQLPGDGNTYVFKFALQSAWTLTSCTFMWTNDLTGTISFAIYDSTGTKITNTDNYMDTSAGGSGANTPVQNTFAATMLPAGIYYFAYASSGGSGLDVPGLPLQFTSTSGTAFLGVINKTGVFIGTAANSRSGNLMPNTLGALTAYTNAGIIMPTPIWST